MKDSEDESKDCSSESTHLNQDSFYFQNKRNEETRKVDSIFESMYGRPEERIQIQMNRR